MHPGSTSYLAQLEDTQDSVVTTLKKHDMKTIKLNFSDFWPGFDKFDNSFTHLLSKYYKIEISEEPDYLIYSVYSNDHKKEKWKGVVKILYTGENTLPDLLECDYALSFSYIKSQRSYRLPLYYFYCAADKFTKLEQNIYPKFYCIPHIITQRQRNATTKTLKEKTGFCSFVVSNPNCKERNNFFYKLSEYKKVSSGGRFLNNTGGPVIDKIAFLSSHKFNIAFENSSSPGYTTEKLLEAYLAGTVPIYWGNKLIEKDFNKNAFICVHDFKNINAVIDRVIELDNDDEQMIQMLNQPLFTNNQINEYVKEENIIDFFNFIFFNGKNKDFVFDLDYWRTYLLRKTRNFLIRPCVPEV